MLPYLLKSSICLAVFLLFYKLLLERERMHVFKRYYLLVALIIAFVIPLITFTEYVQITESVAITDTLEMDQAKDRILHPAPESIQDSEPINSATASVEASWSDHLPLLLWIVYLSGMLFFAFRFSRNLWRILRNIRKNSKYRARDVIYILMQREVVPHTFFDYIFLNKQRFESDAIPEEVLIHEATHARQKHSFDVLFVELLQLIFWFNPLIYFTKKSIKLNHEFLADFAVLNSGTDTPSYQNILLDFASSTKHRDHQPSMANALDHSIHSSINLTLFGKTFHLGRNAGGQVKKRFTVMKAKTSKKSVYLKSLLVAPLLALLLYGFTETNVVYTSVPDKEEVSASIASENLERDVNESKKIEKALDNESHADRTVKIAGLILDSETLKPLEGAVILDLKGKRIAKTDAQGFFKTEFSELSPRELMFGFTVQKDDYKSITNKEHWGDLSGEVKSLFYFGLKKEGTYALELSEARLAGRTSKLSYEEVLDGFEPVKEFYELEKTLEALKKGNERILFEIGEALYLVNDTGAIEIDSRNDLVLINDERIVPAWKIDDLTDRSEITGMTPLANKEATFSVYTIPVDHTVRPIEMATTDAQDQEGASRKQVREYNRLAKKYNTMLAEKGNIWIEKSEVERMEELYAIMSNEQKSNSEPFPDFPEPPTAPTPPAPPATSQQPVPAIRPSSPSQPSQPVSPSEAISRQQEQAVQKQAKAVERQARAVEREAERIEKQAAALARETEGRDRETAAVEREAIRVERQAERNRLRDERAKQEAKRTKANILSAQSRAELEAERKKLTQERRNLAEEREKLQKEYQRLMKEVEMDIDENVKINLRENIQKLIESAVSIEDINVDEIIHEIVANQEIYDHLGNVRLNRDIQRIVELEQDNLRIPAPPAPPVPKTPLEFLRELKDEDLQILYNGEEIEYAEAEKLFEEETFTRVNVSKSKNERPVLSVWTE